MSVLDNYTQTEDNGKLEELLSEKPTFNPAHCNFVPPKRNDLNSLKVEKDIDLTLDFLSRGVHGFKELPSYLKDDILSKCDSFNQVLQKAYVRSIRLCQLQYIHSIGWDTQLFNLQLPQTGKYLTDSLFVTETEEHNLKFRKRTEEFINHFSKEMFSMHEKYYIDHATNEFEVMLTTYRAICTMPMYAAYCDLHQLLNIESKKQVLNVIVLALNLVCIFAFPAACETCSDLLDNILRKQVFAPGEAHQVLLKLPKFEEEILYVRPRPLPAGPKPAGKVTSATAQATVQTPKKVSNMHVILHNK